MIAADIHHERLGDVIRRRREGRGLSLRELAKIVGTSPSHLCRIEGDEKMPSAELVIALRRRLGGPENEWRPAVLNNLYGQWRARTLTSKSAFPTEEQ